MFANWVQKSQKLVAALDIQLRDQPFNAGDGGQEILGGIFGHGVV